MSRVIAFYVGIALLAALAIGPNCRAEEPDQEALTPQLDEIESFYLATPTAPEAKPAKEPAWVAAGRKGVANLIQRNKVNSLPGMRKYDLSRPPRRFYWWNLPIYAVLGFPRDLIDGFFGSLSLAEIAIFEPFNLVLTGVGYELVPTQVLARHPSDWHRWPGRRNANGHGWFDGEWGFFSNLHYTTFIRTNEKRLDVWRTHNQVVDDKMAAENAKIDQENAEVRAKRAAYIRETRRLFDEGKHRVVIQRLVGYREIDPLNQDARAMLAVSLIDDLPEIAENQWAYGAIHDLLWGSSREVLIPIRDELEAMREAKPHDDEICRYLVAINMRLRSFAQAMSAAEELVARDPSNVTFLRLRFEVALAGGDSDQIEEAARAIEQAASEGSAATLHARGRQAFVAQQPEKAVEAYQRLVLIEPLNPRFHYLLGMAHVVEGRKTGHYEKGLARRQLAKAMKLVRSTDERDLYAKAYEAAGLLRVTAP